MPAAGTICRFAWPLEIGAYNKGLRVTIDGITETLNITEGHYWILDSGTAGVDFISVLAATLKTHSKNKDFSIFLRANGKIDFYLVGFAFSILWTHGDTTFDANWIGYHNNADTVGVNDGGTYKAYGAHQACYLFNPERMYSDDTGLLQDHDIARSVDLSGGPTTYRYSTTNYKTILLDILPFTKIFYEDAAVNESFDLFLEYVSQGGKFVWTPDIAGPTVISTWYIKDSKFIEVWPVVQMSELSRYYRIHIPMLSTTFGV